VPKNGRRGQQWADHRVVINGILWKVRTGAPWRAKKGGGGAAETACDEALGRSRGGLTTKLHLACDGTGRPLSVVLTPGQRHDSTQLGPVLDAIRVPRPGGRGRPRKRPDRLIGDKGYSYERCRRLLRQRGIAHVIPERSDQRARRATKPGRKPAFAAETSRRRNVVERCVNRLKQWRGIATRFDKRAANSRAMVVIAALVIWLGQ
jgi:transposase